MLRAKAREAESAQLTRLKRERDEALAREKQLQKVVDHQQELLSRQVKVFKSAKEQASTGTWYRVIVPDSHGSHIDRPAAAAFLRDLEYLKPREVVWIGDHLDCSGFLAQHHTWGYVAETSYTFADDVTQANAFLDSVSERCPMATHHYIEGNHERRLERFCVTQSLRNGTDAAFLLSKFGVGASLHLRDRGFHHYEQGKVYGGLTVPATIKLGACHFTHGSINARRPAQKMLVKFAHNVAFGHNHTGDVVIERILERDCIAACVQSLCIRQPMWKHTDPSSWSHGYGLQVIRKNGEFLHVSVPIVDGKSLLGSLLGRGVK